MRFRNAIRLLTDNFSNVYKLLLFRIVTGLLFFSVAYVIVMRGLHVIFVSPETHEIVTLIKDFVKELSTGNPQFESLLGYRNDITSAIANFFVMVGTNVGSIIGSFIGVCAIYLLSRFLNGTATFAVGSVINDRMVSYSRTRFGSAYFKYLGKSALYQLIYVPISFLYDVVALASCWFFFFYTPSFLPSWGVVTVFFGLSLSVTALICLQALKLTFISAWIPAILLDGMSVLEGCKVSFKAIKGFGGRFSNYLISIYLIVVCSILFGMCTFGSTLLITIPAGTILILCIQLVFYYEDTNRKFFLSFRKISGADGKPESMGD